MSCKFCFAKFQNIPEQRKKESISLVKILANAGFEKINYVGGEPTLYPWLKSLLQEANNNGMTTTIVTNGSLINEHWFNQHSEYLDWIGFSIDSLLPEINLKLGRYLKNSKSPGFHDYLELLDMAKEIGLKTKVNTVVNQLNKDENFHVLISDVKPDKWKIFQVLIIEGENDRAKSLTVSREEFETFLVNHISLTAYTTIYPEYNEDMIGSYLMIDPSGCFYDNSSGVYVRSEKILKVGVSNALKQIEVSREKYDTRHDSTRIKKLFSL